MQLILQSYDSKLTKSPFFADFENYNSEIVNKIYQVVSISPKQSSGFVIANRDRGGLARREFVSFPVGRSTVVRSSDSLGYLKPNFKKLTNDQEYEPVP